MDIKFNDVCFGYGDHPVLRNIDLNLQGPGLICIIGPNGVGKSTLIRCINGLLKPTSGNVTIDGRNVSDYKPSELAEFMGYVPVTSGDCFAMSVFDTVLMGRYKRNKWITSSEDIGATERTLKLLELRNLAMNSFNELSAGQHQKVAIARGLVREPMILILDEPTSNLDVRHQVYVTELLHELAIQCNMLVIMISHDLNISARYADKIVVMGHPGIIRAVGDPSDVITESMVREVYGVENEVIYRDGRPHVILGSAIDGFTVTDVRYQQFIRPVRNHGAVFFIELVFTVVA